MTFFNKVTNITKENFYIIFYFERNVIDLKKYVTLFFFSLILCISTCFAIEIDCPNAILIEASTGKVLYEKNSTEEVNPASLTKVMTAIITLEKGSLRDNVIASRNAIISVPSDGSNTAIQVGEMISVENLLKSLLVASGNESANILAEYIAESNENFANLMNQKAIELGCEHTHFVNPSGLTEEGHYSCAKDLAIMYKYAYDNFEVFRNIIGMTSISLPTSDKYSKERIFNTSNKLVFPSSGDNSFYYEYCTGGKTGYTTLAKNCLVASASKDGVNLIACVLGGTQDENTTSQRFNDSINLFEYGFSSIKLHTFVYANSIIDKFPIKNGKEDYIHAVAHNDIKALISSGDSISTFEPLISFSGDLEAPIFSGDLLGTITYNIYGKEYTENIYANETVEAAPVFLEKIATVVSNIIGIAIIIVVIIIIIIILIIVIKRRLSKGSKGNRIKIMRKYNARFHR